MRENNELFNETSIAFHANPFDPAVSVRHSFLPSTLYVALVSLFGNKTVISENFLSDILTSQELQILVAGSKEQEQVVITRPGNDLVPESSLEFIIEKDLFSLENNSYERVQMRARVENTDQWIFVDTIGLPRLDSELLFAYQGEFNQSDILQKQILENCR